MCLKHFMCLFISLLSSQSKLGSLSAQDENGDLSRQVHAVIPLYRSLVLKSGASDI